MSESGCRGENHGEYQDRGAFSADSLPFLSSGYFAGQVMPPVVADSASTNITYIVVFARSVFLAIVEVLTSSSEISSSASFTSSSRTSRTAQSALVLAQDWPEERREVTPLSL